MYPVRSFGTCCGHLPQDAPERHHLSGGVMQKQPATNGSHSPHAELFVDDLTSNRSCGTISFGRNESIYEEGDPAVCFYQVKSGPCGRARFWSTVAGRSPASISSTISSALNRGSRIVSRPRPLAPPEPSPMSNTAQRADSHGSTIVCLATPSRPP